MSSNRFTYKSALTAAKSEPAAFAAEFRKDGADANIQRNGIEPLLCTLITEIDDTDLPPLLEILRQNRINFETEESLTNATPLATAVFYRKKSAFDFLMQQRVAITGKKSPAFSNFSPYCAGNKNTIVTIAMLEQLRERASAIQVNVIDEQNKYKQTALHKAVEFNDIDLITYLLSKNANMFLHDTFGQTALLIAYIEYVDGMPELENLVKREKTCFDLLIQSAYKYFYQKAMNYGGTEQELYEELNKDVIKLAGNYKNAADSEETHKKYKNYSTHLKKYIDEEVLLPALQQAQYDTLTSPSDIAKIVSGERVLMKYIFSFFHIPEKEQSCLPAPSGTSYLSRNPR